MRTSNYEVCRVAAHVIYILVYVPWRDISFVTRKFKLLTRSAALFADGAIVEMGECRRIYTKLRAMDRV